MCLCGFPTLYETTNLLLGKLHLLVFIVKSYFILHLPYSVVVSGFSTSLIFPLLSAFLVKNISSFINLSMQSIVNSSSCYHEVVQKH